MKDQNNNEHLRPVRSPILDFIKTESFGGILLLIMAVLAIYAANSSFAAAYHHIWEEVIQLRLFGIEISFNLHFFINDILMVIFFFVVGLEIKRELLVGELSSFKKASFPVIAAAGGIAIPALIYIVINNTMEGDISGWAIPSATDIAFTLGLIALLGRRVPLSLKIFIIALAIVDDLAAVIIIAFFYSSGLSLFNLLLAGIFVIGLFGLNKFKVNSSIFYILFGGFIWYFLLKAGIHPTIGGVITAMFIPAKSFINARDFIHKTDNSLKEYKESLELKESILNNKRRQTYLYTISSTAYNALPMLLRLEHSLHPYVTYFIMPVFALANAGVTIDSGGSSGFDSPVFWGIALGLILGKPIGIFLFSWAAVKAKLTELPTGANYPKVFAISIFGGIGFTMSIFISNLAFAPENPNFSIAKIAILVGSFSAALLGIAANLLIKKKIHSV